MPQIAPIAFRITPQLKAGMQAAAEADHRSMSSLITLILEAWLRGERYATTFDPADITAPREPDAAPIYKRPPGRPRAPLEPGIQLDPQAPQVQRWLGDRESATVEEVLTGALNLPPEQRVPFEDKHVENMLHELGWGEFIDEFGDIVWLCPKMTRELIGA